MNPTGNGGSEIFRMPLKDGHPRRPSTTTSSIGRLPGRRSHEYFPELSADGKWLVWGITQRGHDHDIADYEIYLWEVGTPQESAVRLTYHSGNDGWPDIFIPSAAPALAASVPASSPPPASASRTGAGSARRCARTGNAPAKGKKPKHGKGPRKK